MPPFVLARAAAAPPRRARPLRRTVALFALSFAGLAAASCADPAAPTARPRRDLGFPPDGPPDETCKEKEARIGGPVWCVDSPELTMVIPINDSLLLTADSAAAAPGSTVTFTASARSGLPVFTRSWIWAPDYDPDADPDAYVSTFVGLCAGSATCAYTVSGPGRMYVIGHVGAAPELRQADAHVDVARPKLEIVDLDSNRVVSGRSGPAAATLIGRRMHLLARAQDTAKYQMSAPAWTIAAGNPIKDYVFTKAVGRVDTLGPADLAAARVKFYFTTGWWSAPVRVRATLTNKQTGRATPVTAVAPYSPAGPTNVSMVTATTACGVTVGPYAPNPVGLSFGQPGSGSCGPGIRFTFTATAPGGDGNGYVAATQLSSSTESITPNPAAARPSRPAEDSHGAYWLDACLLYNPARHPVNAGYTWWGSDAPETPLTRRWNAYTRADLFDIYFMYRPSGTNSIWVPIGKLSWNWAGTATRTGPSTINKGWQGPTNASYSQDPSGTAVANFPTWNQRFPGADDKCPAVPTS